MSEYQYVAFRAIDRPVQDANLAFMRRQSSRAEVTPWSFENEYDYGDFRGNAFEMLRRGYDIHLHYANFGIRKLLIRLPQGPPDPKSFQRYVLKDALEFQKDQQGPGRTLFIVPYLEPGDLDDLWEVSQLLDRLVPLRAELLDGDLRPLYLAHLAVSRDGNHYSDNFPEAPVPAGLNELTDAQRALAELYGLSDDLIAAAASESPPIPKRDDSAPNHAQWLREQPEKAKNAWLAALMKDSSAAVRSELLAKYRADLGASAWPTVRPNRTMAQLQAAATEIGEKARQLAAKTAARRRAKRLVEMAKNPTATLRETEKLAQQQTRDAYTRIANLLTDLREALAGSDRSDLAEQQSQKLKEAHPTRRILVGELRRQGFLVKRKGVRNDA